MKQAALSLLALAILALGCSGAGTGRDPQVPNLRPPGAEPIPDLPAPVPDPPDEAAPEVPPGVLADLLKPRLEDQAYRMRAGDVINVTVYDHPDLSLTLRIPGNGVGKFPLIGDVEMAGRTVDEAEDDIRSRLEESFVTLAPVSVMVRDYSPCSAYVIGRVAQPGAYEFPTNRPLSLLQLVARARGFLSDADTKRLKLLRGSGEARRYWILSVEDIERSGRINLDVELEDGDTVIVQKLPLVHILGCVRNPGALQAESSEKLTLSRAIAKAGGFVQGADQESILLYRSGAGGDKVFRVAFGSLRGDREAPKDVALYPGDTVLVRCADKVFVLGEVTRPGGFALSEEGLSATKAIALAGGFTRRAETGGTLVVRQGAKGQVLIPVPFRSVVGSGEEDQVMLAPGDIVYVPERFF